MDGFLTGRAYAGAMGCTDAVDASVWDKHAEPLPTIWAELCLISHPLATPWATALDYYTAWRHIHHKLPHRANFTQVLSQMLSQFVGSVGPCWSGRGEIITIRVIPTRPGQILDNKDKIRTWLYSHSTIQC